MHKNNINNIHPMAVISEGAQIGKGVEIGAYAIIGPNVIIGDNSKIGAHAVIDGYTTIAQNVSISSFAVVGGAPQDITYKGEPTKVFIGDNTIIREFVTVHRGTTGGCGITNIGKNCLIMAYCHIAHDCQIADNVIMANGATLGGHVTIDEHAVLGGVIAVHQFCHIGAYAFIGGMSGVNKDIPPFVKFFGIRGDMYGLNVVGLRRHRFPKEHIEALKKAYRRIFHSDITVKAGAQEVLKDMGDIPPVKTFCEFILNSSRGLPRSAGMEATADV